ncbi:MAG: V-type ATP synthase subunit K [Candidatus Firestonebacteria bacterium]|nr:V-type ATP synthase subunit K [Candidatus Firestonebacteria bacterium]
MDGVINGLSLAILGAIITIVVSGYGSAKGIAIAADVANGVLSENPDMFGKLLIMVALPGTQGIYGFVTGILVFIKLGIIGGQNIYPITVTQGMQIFFICAIQSIIECTSAIYQGKVAASGIAMTGKQPDASMKGVIMAVLVETYAVLGLLAGILGVLFGIRI